MKVLLIDNYDSFTYNLYQFVGELLEKQDIGFQLDVKRNNEISLEQIYEKQYQRVILSPGPGEPGDKSYFGVCSQVILEYGKTQPVLGVCLGMQGIALYFGGKIVRASIPKHGKISKITHDGRGVFKGLPQDLEVMRYHSLIAEIASLPDCLEVTAQVPLAEGNYEIMGVRHRELPIEGIQFHPESFATEGGKVMLANFLFPNS
ncbi:MAG: aminodeoxychorismate/anthranilate synthase component II [Spirochaetota bacterium]